LPSRSRLDEVRTENGKLRVSENRSKVYFDYAEREQIQDDKVELKPSAHPSPLTAHRSSGLTWHSATHTLLLDRGELILQENAQTNNSSAFHLQVEELPTGTVPTAKDFLNKSQAFVDADSIKGKLTLRPMRQGDRFRPYGMKQGSKLLSDFLTDRKVSLLDKQAQLVATDTATNAIIWVVGREIDHRYRITPTTKRILRLFCVDG
jgi:tRNA(Ile)-lysidine synthase